MTDFSKGDRVRSLLQPRCVAEVTYVSPDEDYAELRYADGFTFRSRKSEWAKDRKGQA